MYLWFDCGFFYFSESFVGTSETPFLSIGSKNVVGALIRGMGGPRVFAITVLTLSSSGPQGLVRSPNIYAQTLAIGQCYEMHLQTESTPIASCSTLTRSYSSSYVLNILFLVGAVKCKGLCVILPVKVVSILRPNLKHF